MYIIQIEFNSGFFKGQIWLYKNLTYENVLYHYKVLPKDFKNDVVVYVYTGQGRFFISDFIKKQQQIKIIETMN